MVLGNEKAYITDVQYGVTGYGVQQRGIQGLDFIMGTDFDIRVARSPSILVVFDLLYVLVVIVRRTRNL
jgi:hypothetical protein